MTKIEGTMFKGGGDIKMNFFHQMANSNRRTNSIGSLNIDGVLTLDQEVIEDGIV